MSYLRYFTDIIYVALFFSNIPTFHARRVQYQDYYGNNYNQNLGLESMINTALGKLDHSLQWMKEWPEPVKLGQVSGVALDGASHVLVFHRATNVWDATTFSERNVYQSIGEPPISQPTILVFNETGELIDMWGKNLFYIPHGITVDSNGNVWVTDVALHQVFKFTPDQKDKPALVLGEKFIPGNDDEHFCKPTSVAVMANGDFFVADGYCNHRILKFSPQGEIILQWGKGSYQSISSSNFPRIWKDAQVIPLTKKSNPDCMSDFRPISILPFLSKVLERLIHNQISEYLRVNNLLNPIQSGFPPGHSTASALVKITDDIRFGMENLQLTALTLLDFSSAFNNVDFEILLSLLCSLNISPAVIDWFRSYLHGRRQRVVVGESFSQWCTLTAGVPQGGVLSPLPFAIFINSITLNLTSTCHLYADDLQIYTRARLENLNSAINILNSDLPLITEWSHSFGLTINPTKTQCIIIGSPYFISRMDFKQLPSVTLNGTLPIF
ncbi:hypothetical protein evm_011880 [Chilo suppressalis]|nr:hypothetical protein evm_011880 [Chilo suppressalis]